MLITLLNVLLHNFCLQNDGVNTEMPINLHGVIQDSLFYAIMFFLKSVECDTDQVIKPDYVLHRLTENSKYVV